MLSMANDTANSSIFFRRSKGTHASPTIVTDGLDLGAIYASGYDGAGFIGGAAIKFEVDGVPGVNDMPGRISLFTTSDNSSSVRSET